MRELVTKPKQDQIKRPNSVIECVRLGDGVYLFDELAIIEIQVNYMGRSIFFEYERNGIRLDKLTPVTVTADEFARARQDATRPDGTIDTEKFAQSKLVERLFSDASRQWIEANKKANANFLDDVDFFETMKTQTQQPA